MGLQRLGVLAVYTSKAQLEELTFYRKLSRAGRKLGLEIQVFTPEDVKGPDTLHILKYDAAAHKWVQERTTFPPLIYDRCRYHGSATYQILKAFRNKYTNLRYLSKPLANKWKMHQVLRQDSAMADHIPTTERYRNPQALIRFLKKYPLIYIKPKNGTGGRGILRVEQVGKDLYLIQGRDQQRVILSPQKTSEKQLAVKLHSMKLSADYIIQQGIALTMRDGRVHDYRLLIQKNGSGQWEVTGCAGRIGPYGSITSNLHGGGSAVSMEKLLSERFPSKWRVEQLKHEIYSFAYQLAPYLETRFGKLCELGIDIAVDPQGGVWLLEVNPKPSREVFRRIGEKETYRKAVTRPLEYSLWLMNEQTGNEQMEELVDVEQLQSPETN